ncbi:MAG: ABC transporter ATP-binding protein [Planctomycetia bacterium]|nr:ABC transporter ATP-binding protein [Planctomycetia bacterium]
MSDIAVEVDHVWKRFHRGEYFDCLRDAVPAFFKSLCGLGPKDSELGRGDFWALKDIHFQVKRGESFGIIGHNGAGKSTMLKILSKIIKPNRGSVTMNGTFGALIEVGAGFHGDLTGRENIYLNATILGMKKAEIDKKFDSIVDFSGIEDFLDTPVKRYSSGMHARLGFAVAIHLDPEILIVDEVLSVGDTQFQKKCLERMEQIVREGRTVLFVSHNMNAVQKLCQRSILLQKGEIFGEGTTKDVLQKYFGTIYTDVEKKTIALRTDRSGNGDARVVDVQVGNSPNPTLSECSCDFGQEVYVRVHYRSVKKIDDPVVSVEFLNYQGEVLFQATTYIHGESMAPFDGKGEIEFHIPQMYLTPGKVDISVSLGNGTGQIFDSIRNVAILHINTNNNLGFRLDSGRWYYRTLFPYDWRKI